MRKIKVANKQRIDGKDFDIKGHGNVISGSGHIIKGNNNVCVIHHSEVTGKFENIKGTHLRLFVDESTLTVDDSTVIGFGNKITGRGNEISGEENEYDTETNTSLTIEKSQPQERKNMVVIEEIERGPDLFSVPKTKKKPIRNLAVPMKATKERKRREDVQQQEEVLLPHELIELANFVNGLQNAVMIEELTGRKEEKKITAPLEIVLPVYTEGKPAPEGSEYICPVCLDTIPNCIFDPCGHEICIPCLHKLANFGPVKCPKCKTKVLQGIKTWK